MAPFLQKPRPPVVKCSLDPQAQPAFPRGLSFRFTLPPPNIVRCVSLLFKAALLERADPSLMPHPAQNYFSDSFKSGGIGTLFHPATSTRVSIFVLNDGYPKRPRDRWAHFSAYEDEFAAFVFLQKFKSFLLRVPRRLVHRTLIVFSRPRFYFFSLCPFCDSITFC